MIIESTLKTKLIYIFAIADEAHKDCLKIGEATIGEEHLPWELVPNSGLLNEAAKARINQYTQTAGIDYQLLHTEPALMIKDKHYHGFNDKKVHDVLLRSGIKRKEFNLGKGKASEWFIVDLETAKKAIQAVREGKDALEGHQITSGKTPLVLRSEQRDAIDRTKSRFETSDQMLWNAKMRFGKTITALQLFKELATEDAHYRRMLILTHRPVVDAGWFTDFTKVFYDDDTNFLYGSKIIGDSFTNFEKRIKKDKNFHYVYFASIQDLRGSSFVGGKFEKNDELFSAKWDLLVIDEAHEGTQTELGDKVIKALIKKGTKVLSLSGTPFNLFAKYKEEEIYTWSYVDEQKKKANWSKDHEGDYNPYADLPRMNMFTYDLGEHFNEFQDGEYSFNFHEFFRTLPTADPKEIPEFVHKQHVLDFLNMLCEDSKDSNYPYSNETYRNYFRHTLWMIPGVKEGLALEKLLKEHPVFGNFDIANVAGDGDPEDPKGEALKKVNDKITDHPEDTYTITLSCGKLTTGVTVKPWTAVFMLSGTAKTGAATYMQTIFRVQSAGNIGGKQKTEAYVFDFAPDRVLTVMANAAKASTRPGKATDEQRQRLQELLNYFPVIALQGSKTRRYDVDQLLTRLKHTYIEKVVNSGFTSTSLYNERLLHLDDMELKDFDELKADIGSSPAMDGGKDIIINDQGLDDEEKSQGKEPRSKTPLTEEEKEARKLLKKKKDERKSAISILSGISIRMPMLIYGADLKDGEDITIDNFTDHIDPRSWEEFMPNKVTKQRFNNFKKYYDPEIFLEAGRQIRKRASVADGMRITERIRHITQIFDTFRNPDKETVLTPWRVVNMHLSDTIGGFDFYEPTHTERQEEPRFVDHGAVTNRIFMSEKGKILELNSKSGLYPLYMAYSMWRERCREWERQGFFEVSKMTLEEEQTAWDDVIQNNIFVICKTPMAVSITRRTLVGFRDVHDVHAKYYPDLIETLKNDPDKFIEDIALKPRRFWGNNKLENNMKFNAIVGNPPYQVMDGGNSNSAIPLYHYFVNIAKRINPKYISIIMPSRWLSGGRGLDTFRDEMLHDDRMCLLHDYFQTEDCFQNVDIKGGISYFLIDSTYHGNCNIVSHHNGKIIKTFRPLLEDGVDTFIRSEEQISVLYKVRKAKELSFCTWLNPGRYYGFHTKVEWEDNEIDGSIQSADGKDSYPITKTKINNNQVKIYIHGGYCWIDKDLVPKNADKLGDYKVLLPRSGNPNTIIIGKPFICEPEACSSNTYVVVHCPKGKMTEEIATNVYNYIRTKFFRFMVVTRTTTQSMSLPAYEFVPLQDFSEPWTDEKLYKKYDLTQDEIAYIESLIKPMD